MNPILYILLSIALGGALTFASMALFLYSQRKMQRMMNTHQIMMAKEQPDSIKAQANFQRALADRENLAYQHEEDMEK